MCPVILLTHKRLILICSLLCLSLGGVRGSADTNGVSSSDAKGSADKLFVNTNRISFSQFLTEVAAANLDYAAQKYNVPIAQAAVAAAKEFQNPTLALSGGRDVTHSGADRLSDTTGLSLTQTIETGGKRKYRILEARQLHAAASATLEDFLRNLKLDAAAAFADALALSRNAEQKKQSASFLQDLLERQRERFKSGDISDADLLQTSVEERRFHNELLATDAEASKAALALNSFLGKDKAQTLFIPEGNLELSERPFEASTLLSDALNKRPDLVALRRARDAAQSRTHEEKAKRIPNVDVGVGWNHSSSSQNSIAPAPAFNAVAVSLALPLPLWNRNKAAITTAQLTAEQAQKQVEAAELRAEVEIRQTLTMYQTAVERAQNYRSGILQNAESVLSAKRFAYQRGQSTLLDLLEAQRTANEVRTSYNEALADQAKALVELERAAFLWEINF